MQFIACLLAAPAVAGALWFVATDVSELTAPSAATTAFASLADAIQHGQVEDAYAFINTGTDPNAPIPFRDPQLTADREVNVSPLMLATATNNDNAVMMLLSFGARMDLPQNALAICLARQLGHQDIAEMIIRDVKPAPTVTCPQAPSDALAPLLTFVK
jgi:hypothetical protein